MVVVRAKIVCLECSGFAEFNEAMSIFWDIGLVHGTGYEGPHFKYCPFCGAELKVIQVDDH